MASFGKLLRRFRNDADLTQKDLADKLKRTRTAISDWENDKYTPADRDEIERLEEILGLSEIQLGCVIHIYS